MAKKKRLPPLSKTTQVRIAWSDYEIITDEISRINAQPLAFRKETQVSLLHDAIRNFVRCPQCNLVLGQCNCNNPAK